MNDTWDSDDRGGLERLLRDEAAAARRTPHRSVAERVMHALPDRPDRPDRPDCEGRVPPSPAAALVGRAVVPGPRPTLVALAGRFALAAAVAAGLYGLWTWDTIERGPVRPATQQLAIAPRPGLDRLRRLGDVDLELSNPLLEEARRLGRDATSATGFLATRLPPTFRSALFSGL